MRAVIVGGTFDHNEGKPSSVIRKLSESLGWEVINGGSLDIIKSFDFSNVDTLLWMPNIDNSEDKIIPSIKAQNQKLLLISSKRVVEKEYSEFDVIGRLLKTKSNLGIMIQKQGDKYGFKLLDPLGNQYCDTTDINELARALEKRVNEVKAMTRIGSQSIGEGAEIGLDPAFITVVKSLGDEFSLHLNAVNPERFLGNAAARGENNKLYISRRNVDKQNMDVSDFVAVTTEEDKVKYHGDVKPSVDSPIQVRLFNHFNNVNYMIHGHVYVEGAPMTKSRIPCGHIEEFNEVAELFDKNAMDMAVNLRGHGCLILAKDLGFFDTVKLRARPFPEV